ncbi:MAG: CBS domain-containing protein [Cytophagales bacterium]|nr:MAG: CBS domain-containing protein [Cytophagales bacterium]
MKKREPIANIMTKQVITAQETDSLESVVEVFKNNHIRHLPVLNGKKVVGMISSADINRLTFGSLFDNQTAADEAVLKMLSIPQVMTHKVVTVSSDTSVREVAELFAEADFHSVPVTQDGNLEGIITTTDVIKYMLEQY